MERMKKEKSDIICIFVPNGVKPTSRQKNLPYKWEEEDGTFYSVMPREVYNDYLELEEEIKNLKEKQKILDKENCELIDENVKLKEELKKTNELLSNVARCSEQYRGKMISVMEELKMFLYKD